MCPHRRQRQAAGTCVGAALSLQFAENISKVMNVNLRERNMKLLNYLLLLHYRLFGRVRRILQLFRERNDVAKIKLQSKNGLQCQTQH